MAVFDARRPLKQFIKRRHRLTPFAKRRRQPATQARQPAQEDRQQCEHAGEERDDERLEHDERDQRLDDELAGHDVSCCRDQNGKDRTDPGTMERTCGRRVIGGASPDNRGSSAAVSWRADDSFLTKDPMTPEQAAARLFKKERQRIEGEIAMAEYEQRARAEREKTARLRALRLAHEAKLARKPPGAKSAASKIAKSAAAKAAKSGAA